MLTIPIATTPSQVLSVVLGAQSCKISIYQKDVGVFLDLAVAGAPIVSGAICRDRVDVVRHEYLGFAGTLRFVDTQGTLDPDYTGFGARWKLVYLP